MLQGLTKKIVVLFTAIFLLFVSLYIFKWTISKNIVSKRISNATEVNIEKIEPSEVIKLYKLNGILKPKNPIGDLYLKKGKYLILRRNVEMYSWRELLEGSGSYIYKKSWSKRPDDSSRFENKDDYKNPQKDVNDVIVRPNQVNLGQYSVDINNLDFYNFKSVSLNNENTIVLEGFSLRGNYLYKGSGTLENPEVGDIRISYSAVPDDDVDTSIYGYLDHNNNTVVPYFIADKKIFIATKKTKEELALSILEVEPWTLYSGYFGSILIFVFSVWVFRRILV